MERSAMKKITAASFGFAIVCFALPFVTISCNGQTVANFTGYQLVLGTTVQEPQMVGAAQTQKVDPEPWADLAFLSCFAALFLSLVGSRRSELAATVFSGISVVSLLLLRSKLEDSVLKQSGGFLQVNYDIGFWTVFLVTLGSGALAAVARWRKDSHALVPEPGLQSPP